MSRSGDQTVRDAIGGIRPLKESDVMKLNLTQKALAALAAILTFIPTMVLAQIPCKTYSVDVPILQVLKDPNVPSEYVSALQQGDVACLSDDALVGPQRLGFVVEKTPAGGMVVSVGGWASTIFMTEIAADAAGTAATADTTDMTEPAEEDILRFDQPVPYGPPQVRGKTLKELIAGKPMFPPIEGLPENLWQKTCSNCHKWDAKSLCEQGQSYLGRAEEVFRHPHPLGGAYKLSLMRWAKTGCN